MEEGNIQLLDCDVEEPNAHLFLKPKIEQSYDVGISVPTVDLEKCNFCGYCAEVCAFNALAVFQDQVMVLSELCHGCGSCAYFCDIGDQAVEQYCKENKLPVLQKIPWDYELARLYARGETAVLHLPKWRLRFQSLYVRITEIAREVDRR